MSINDTRKRWIQSVGTRHSLDPRKLRSLPTINTLLIAYTLLYSIHTLAVSTVMEYPPLSQTAIYAGFQTFADADSLHFEYPRQCADTKRPTNSPFYAMFFTIGDWGTDDNNEHLVARQLGHAAQFMHPCFTVNMGDNFYSFGVDDVESERWNRTFEQTYNADSLQNMTFFSVLGNHDYRGNPWAQVSRHYAPMNKRWFMPNYWYYTVHTFKDIPTAVPYNPFEAIDNVKDFVDPGADIESREDVQATFIYLDTALLSKSHQPDALIPYDLDDPEMYKIHVDFVTDVLNAASQKPGWLFAVGHYHLLSGSQHENISDLKHLLIPLLTEYNVDAYFNGHLHHFGLNVANNVSYITNGSGGKSKTFEFCLPPTCVSVVTEYGITAHYLTRDKMYFAFIDVNGNILKTFEQTVRPKSGDASLELPPVRRVYIGPDPANSSPSLKTLYFLLGGMLIGAFLTICFYLAFKFAVYWIRKAGKRQDECNQILGHDLNAAQLSS